MIVVMWQAATRHAHLSVGSLIFPYIHLGVAENAAPSTQKHLTLRTHKKLCYMDSKVSSPQARYLLII